MTTDGGRDLDALIRAFATLAGFRDRIPEPYVYDYFVRDYNAAIDQAASSSGLNLDQFKIDDRDLKPMYSNDPSSGRFVQPQFFGAKLDAVLNYLKALLPEDAPRKMGF